MKTPDEIKKGLECCITDNCKECPYYPLYEVFGCKLARAKDALALIQQLEAQVPRWISVKERLPERDKEVLCLFVYPEGTSVCQNVYYGSGHWLGEADHVTHWMPLPEPPKEE